MNDSLFPDSPATPSNSSWVIAHCDGGSRGNPGPSGYGAVLEDERGVVLAELSEFLGIQTNNFAEYSGLLAVLRWAIEHNIERLRVVSDSELMVKQMQGRYKVASPVLKPLFDEAKQLARRIARLELQHTLRAGNKTADRLANEAMDRGMGKKTQPQPASAPLPSGRPQPAAVYTKPPTAPQPAARPRQNRVEVEGYVKNGVVHFLGESIPDGAFVKIIKE